MELWELLKGSMIAVRYVVIIRSSNIQRLKSPRLVQAPGDRQGHRNVHHCARFDCGYDAVLNRSLYRRIQHETASMASDDVKTYSAYFENEQTEGPCAGSGSWQRVSHGAGKAKARPKILELGVTRAWGKFSFVKSCWDLKIYERSNAGDARCTGCICID